MNRRDFLMCVTGAALAVGFARFGKPAEKLPTVRVHGRTRDLVFPLRYEPERGCYYTEYGGETVLNEMRGKDLKGFSILDADGTVWFRTNRDGDYFWNPSERQFVRADIYRHPSVCPVKVDLVESVEGRRMIGMGVDPKLFTGEYA